MIFSQKTFFRILIGLCIIAIGGYFFINKFVLNTRSNQSIPFSAFITTPNQQIIKVRIADTETERSQGLSFFKKLHNNEGMLFVFPEQGFYSFWMKDMSFPIDIIWIDEQGFIVHREIDISPDTYPQSFVSARPAKYILEIAANSSDIFGLTLGQKIEVKERE